MTCYKEKFYTVSYVPVEKLFTFTNNMSNLIYFTNNLTIASVYATKNSILSLSKLT